MSEAATHPSTFAAPSARSLSLKFIVFYALIAATIAACLLIHPPAIMAEPGVVMKWPEHVMGYDGKDEAVTEGEHALLPADTELAKKLYTNAADDHLQAQIVLSGIEHRSIHRPEVCLVGQGWTVSNGTVTSVPLKSGRNLDIMVLDISRPWRAPNGAIIQRPALYAYFFVSKDAETPKHLERIAITNLDLLLHNKSHRWAYVIAMAEITKGLVPNGRDREQTLDLIKQFLRETAPVFLKSEMPAEPPRPAAKS